jgi:hypothetical protein
VLHQGSLRSTFVAARRTLPSAVALVAALSLALPTAGLAAPALVREVNVSANLLGKKFPNNNATEPVVAVDPGNPDNIVLTYNTRGAKCGISPAVRISRDGGRTWTDAPRRPWAGSGRQPNWHAAVAWGPGPAGKSRLYWADTTVADCTYSDHRLSIAFSDDFGASWSALFVYRGSAATPFGGYPDITVDQNPASPRYGTVYAAINWFARSADEPGYRLLASSDHGATWAAAEVPALAAPAGYPFRYRIGYRLRTAPDGALYASFCQRDRKSPTGAVGRLAFGISRVTFDSAKQQLQPAPAVLARAVNVNGYTTGGRAAPGTKDKIRLSPCWSHGLDVDRANGDVYMALGNFKAKMPAGTPRGVILLGRSTDTGKSWSWRDVPTLPAVSGRAQSAHKPQVVVDQGTVFVGFHVLADVPLGTTPPAPAATVGNAYAVSYDRGASFGPAALISVDRWHPDWLDYSRNASGIRDRAELVAPGTVIYAYGDGRHAAAKPSAHWGRGQVYAALIGLGKP